MKKQNILALTLACLLLLSGCQYIPFLQQQPLIDVYDDAIYLAEYQDKWQYSLLSKEYKAYYGSLYTAVTNSAKTESYVTVDNKDTTEQVPGIRVYFPNAEMTREQIISVFEAFFRDNPQFFFLDRTYQLEGHNRSDKSTTYNAIVLRYSMTQNQRSAFSSQLETVINEILADCPQSDEYEIERYLHDQLNDICTYDTQAAGKLAESDPAAYTAFGALVEGVAVCEGYSKAMQLLLHKANIPCTVVTGNSKENGESHMWNLVKINGNTYHLDSTWNDTQNGNLHTYFNLTTKQLSYTHIIDENQSWLPTCSATKDNYFIRTGTFIDTYERQKIATIIADQLQNGNNVIQLSFAEGKFENGLLFLKNTALTTQYVNEHLTDNHLHLEKYTLWVDNEQRVLTIRKK